MKKDTILILIAVAAILALVLPKPAGVIIPLIILIPVVIYLIVDIIKNGNKEKKWKAQFNAMEKGVLEERKMKNYRMMSKVMLVICLCGIVLAVINGFTGIINSSVQISGT